MINSSFIQSNAAKFREDLGDHTGSDCKGRKYTVSGTITSLHSSEYHCGQRRNRKLQISLGGRLRHLVVITVFFLGFDQYIKVSSSFSLPSTPRNIHHPHYNINMSVLRIQRQIQRRLWPLSAFPTRNNICNNNKQSHKPSLSSATSQSLFQSSEYFFQSTLTGTGDSKSTSKINPENQYNNHSPLSSANIHIKKTGVPPNTASIESTQNPNQYDPDPTAASLQNEKHFETLFTIDLPEGKCVGLQFLPTQYQTSLCPSEITSTENHWIKQMLHPEEVQYGIDLPSETARLTFFIGRLAMRTALILSTSDNPSADGQTGSYTNGQVGDPRGIDRQYNDVSVEYEDRKFGGFVQLPVVTNLDQSILKDKFGRPQVPKGFIGSISHKKTTGVALVNSIPISDDDLNPSSKTTLSSSFSPTPKIGIGVDIEQTFSLRRSIAKKILTSNELENLGKLNGVTRDEEVLLRFRLVTLFLPSFYFQSAYINISFEFDCYYCCC